MQLSKLTLSKLAEMICGASPMAGQYEHPGFIYRSSSYLTRFFQDVDLDYQHNGGTRKYWVEEVLTEINRGPSSDSRMPSDDMIRVLQHLFDPVHFQEETYEAGLLQGNKVLARDGLRIDLVEGVIEVSHTQSGIKSSNARPTTRPLSTAERRRRDLLIAYLATASEDDFTQNVVVPLFQHFGFSRVTMKGHRDKSQEYGKDVWMKFPLPSDHFLYCTAQVKIGRIHAAARGSDENVASILAQVLMALRSNIFDPATNSLHLADHVYLITSGEITAQARTYLSDELARSMQRRILFMDREDIVRLWALSSLTLPDERVEADGDIPF